MGPAQYLALPSEVSVTWNSAPAAAIVTDAMLLRSKQ